MVKQLDSIHILIIEDSIDILNSFKDYASLNNLINVVCAQSCCDAIKIMNEFKFKAVISDINLSDGNGLDVLEAFYKNYPSTFRVAMSGYEKNIVFKNANNLIIVQKYLKKPITFENLDHTISMIITK